MKDHMSKFKQLQIRADYGCHLTSCSDESNVHLKDLGCDYFIAKKKNSNESAIFDKMGNIIIPFDEHYYLGSTEDTLLVFTRRSISIYGIRLKDGQGLYHVESYGDNTGKYERLDYEENGILKSKTYSFILDKHKRYRVFTEYGAPICDKILDYKIYSSKLNSIRDFNYYAALRFEDGFGILRGDGTITYSKCIIPLNGDKAPLLIGNLDNKGKMYYNFLSNDGSIKKDLIIEEVFQSMYDENANQDLYLAKIRYDEFKFTRDYAYIFLKQNGEILNNLHYQYALPIRSNRTFIWYDGEAYGKLMDEQGRMIKQDTYQVKEIIKNFTKVKYGDFLMTLARVKLIDDKEVYIDKEFNIYPDIDKIIVPIF